LSRLFLSWSMLFCYVTMARRTSASHLRSHSQSVMWWRAVEPAWHWTFHNLQLYAYFSLDNFFPHSTGLPRSIWFDSINWWHQQVSAPSIVKTRKIWKIALDADIVFVFYLPPHSGLVALFGTSHTNTLL
jgi:hypothetical protein